MTEAELVALILALPEAAQSSHFGTTDFRVRNKGSFCTLPQPGRLVLKLTPEQQDMLMASDPAFQPLSNKWGRSGWTGAEVGGLDDATARSVLRMAWGNVAPKALVRGS